MASSYAVPFGPTFNPYFEPESGFFFDDFVAYSASAADLTPWADVSSSGSEAASAAEPWGAVAIVNGAAAGNDGGIELNGEPFAFDHTKDLMFGVRFKVSSITGGDIFLGLHTEGFDVGSGAAITSTHLGFHTQGDANLDFSTANGSSQTITDTTVNLVASTYVIAVWKYSAVDRTVRIYVDGTLYATNVVGTANLPATGTQMTCGLHNDFHSAASTLTVDWVYVAGER